MPRTWTVTIDLFDADEVRSDEPITTAHAVLTTATGGTLNGYGRARLNPDDENVPEIGEELAAARALRDLADRLLRTTSDDIAAREHRQVRLHP
ncbi:dsRBD fold-containing protein [Georgenia sp. AZ-5]|uniref:dsRBD fold-containing protein n=1 Tax=Georgenia sp. AZ-5 TaxID=3367526 RepID=UPI00375508FD